jgi:hypothetical protein
MDENSVRPGVHTLGALLSGKRNARDFTGAKKIFQTMRAQNMPYGTTELR